MKSVHHLFIENEMAIMDFKNYFPNATALTLERTIVMDRNSLPKVLNKIIPLHMLTKLTLDCYHFSFMKLLKLLCMTPSLHTLVFQSLPFYKDNALSIQRSEVFKLVSKTNKITNVKFKELCTLEKIRLLVVLFHQMQHLTLQVLKRDLEPVARLLLQSARENINRLCSLHFSRATTSSFQMLEKMIKSEQLLVNYEINIFFSEIYLWW